MPGRWRWLVSAVGGAVASCAAAQPASAPQPQASAVRATLGLGEAEVVIAAPDAARSPATLVNRVGDKPGAAATEFTLHAAVLVRADASVHERARAIGSVPGWWRIDTETVADAVQLARALASRDGVRSASVATSRPFTTRTGPDDPSLPQAWHLENLAQPGNDINARGAWALGYSGDGVEIGIMDAGVLLFHEDLAANVDFALCQLQGPSNHGTSVAGVVAAVGNNDTGAAGLAYGATIGQQFYYRGFEPGDVGPLTNAEGITFANDRLDVRNNSWGPPDNSRYHPLDPIEADALETVTSQGREGKGGILVWAAGNGSLIDRTDYDGFASSRHTIAIGAIGHLGVRAIYNERGSSMMGVAWSDGNVDTSNNNLQRRIYTTTASSNSAYTQSFGGTSAAAPLASGAVALVLEANPDLTWRDVQHLVVDTALPVDPGDPLWTTNGAAHAFSDNYGFGRLDAAAMVTAAETWQFVAPAVQTDSGTISIDQPIPDGDPSGGLSIAIPIGAQLRVEHAELRLRVEGTYVGDVSVELVSPAGTVSTLATPRNSDADVIDHLFTSVKHWDETSSGVWTLRVSDAITGDTHTLIEAQLVIHGTCAGDQDRSGTLTTDDLAAWIANYQNAHPDAETNGDGRITPADFNGFIRAYSLGC